MAEQANTNDLRRGMVIDLPDGLFEVISFEHHKPGKGGAVVRTKIRNLKNGAVLDKTFNSDTKVPVARVDRREMQYLYKDGDDFVFMDNETYDQQHVGSTLVADDVSRFLIEGTTCIVASVDGAAISVDLPTTVDLLVTKSDPGLKGDRSNAGTKPATLQTGANVQVPLFVNEGDTVRIDTRTGAYVTRVQS